VARFAKVAWDDVNNGCANPRFSHREWFDHFNDKHAEKANLLLDMLYTAYLAYIEEVK
jgi:hypothetical protein